MRKLLIWLLSFLWVILVTILFFIGNPRNQFVKTVTRKTESIYKNREQKKYEKVLSEQAMVEEKERLKTLKEEELIKNLAFSIYNSGTIALKSWNYSLAIQYFDEAIMIDSWYAKFWINKAIAQSSNWDKQTAISSYDQALVIDNTKFQARKAKAIIYFNTWAYKEAIQNFDEALTINSGEVSLRINKWVAHYYLNQYPKAIESYNNAIIHDPGNTNALYNLWIVLKDMWNYGESLKYFQIVENLDPNKKWLFYQMWLSAYWSGLLDIAYDSFLKAYEQNIDNQEILKNIWKIAFELWNYNQSISYFDEYLRIFWENAQVRAYRGNAYYEQEDYKKAYLSYKKSLRLKSDKIVKDNFLRAEAQMQK